MLGIFPLAWECYKLPNTLYGYNNVIVTSSMGWIMRKVTLVKRCQLVVKLQHWNILKTEKLKNKQSIIT